MVDMAPWKILVIDGDPDVRQIATLAIERGGGLPGRACVQL